jgi:hypothetical protein
MRFQPAYLALSLLAACGGGGNTTPDALVVVPDAEIDAPPPPPDAQQFDFSCMNNPAPTTADDPITVSGFATGLDIQGMQPQTVPLTDATIAACVADCVGENQLDADTTDSTCPSTGCPWTVDLPTGGTPLDGYVRATKATFRTSNIFAPAPLIADTPNVPVLAFSTTAFQLFTAVFGINHTPGNSDLGLVITDCANTPIGNATIVLEQDGTEVSNTTVLDASTLDPSAQGTYLVFNVPPGETVVKASINGMALRPRTVLTFADQTSATQLSPGFQ